MLTIIPLAFGHEKGVGKDTAARFLVSHLRTTRNGSNIQKKGFADKLKSMCYELYSWAGLMPGPWYEENSHRYKLKDEILPLLGKSPRKVWIEFGTSVGRAVYGSTWVEYLLRNAKCDILIVSDCRFPDEADMIKKRGGFVFKIERPGTVRSSDIADDALLGYDGWTGIIQNDSELFDFNNKIVGLAKEYLK